MTTGRVGALLGAVVALLFVVSTWASAVAFGQQATPVYPTITLDRSVVHPGDRVVVQFHGWKGSSVTLTLCGNLARRGSVDCNIVASQGVPISQFTPESLTAFVVPTPPTTCPCVLRASDSTQTAVAYTPIVLIGVPTGPLVSPSDYSPLDVAVTVKRAHGTIGDALKSSLGGATSYDVSLTLRNKSADTLTGVRPYGFGGRSRSDQARAFEFPPVGDLGPGQSWTHVVRVPTPAPDVGRFYWEVSVSGAGPTVHSESVTRATPLLLVAIVVLIVVDLAVMLVRRITRRGRKSRTIVDGEFAGSPV
jgi:hypothetical protein